VAGPLKLEDLQSFEELFAPKQEMSAAKREQRRSDRKAAELTGSITVDGYMSVIQTVDLSLGGMSLRAERLLGVGKEAHISFSLDDANSVAATVRIVYCFFTQDEDFRAGLEFLKISNGADALTQFLQG
jgi:c-di-GMP-binding flagellar brake protein YcgR